MPRTPPTDMTNVSLIPGTSSAQQVIDDEQCIFCNGSLDTGWVCNECGTDFYHVTLRYKTLMGQWDNKAS
jgi:hypothetical protein